MIFKETIIVDMEEIRELPFGSQWVEYLSSRFSRPINQSGKLSWILKGVVENDVLQSSTSSERMFEGSVAVFSIADYNALLNLVYQLEQHLKISDQHTGLVESIQEILKSE